ncbi:hypothetical protein JCM10213_009063 [Rhodosporidiobolus nylandii]
MERDPAALDARVWDVFVIWMQNTTLCIGQWGNPLSLSRTPLLSQSSKDGQPMYEKLGFVVEGGSEYVKMVRWGKNGQRREDSGH